jgi:hypothetical protein
MPVKKSNSSPAVRAQALLASRKKTSEGSTKKTKEEMVRMVETGELVEWMISDLKKHGVNDRREPLIFYRLFTEGVSLIGDLRVGAVWTTGISQASKTAANSAVCAWLSQRAHLTTAWTWPLAESVDRFQPMQHKPLLEHLAFDVSKAKVTKNSNTSNRLFDVGLGRAIYHSLGKGSAVINADAATVGAASASYTSDCVWAEECSQVKQSLLAPLLSRVEKSISPVLPFRALSTRGSSGGIELSIATHAEYQFSPHCVCNHCNTEIELHPFGTILKPVQVVNPVSGELEEQYLSNTGNIIDWHKDEDGNPYIGCSNCGKELDDTVRMDCYFKCTKSGLTVPQFIEQVLIPEWQTRRIQISLDFTAPSRQKKGRLAARAIIEEGINPANLSDFLEQRLGVDSGKIGGSISQENIDSAFARYPLVVPDSDSVRLIGIDQGRNAWWCSVMDFKIPRNATDVNEIWNNIRGNLLFCKGIPVNELHSVLQEYKVVGGALDSKPSIIFAHQTREDTGLVMAEQFANVSISDDIRPGTIKDAGMEFPVWKFRTSKPGRSVLDSFIAGRIGIHPDLKQYNDLRPDSFAKHLRSVSWDTELATIKKASDGNDDLFFSLVFCYLALQVYLIDPQEVLIQSWSWWE